MSVLVDFLKKNNYKFISKNSFQEKIKEFFGIFDYSENKIFHLFHPKDYEINTELKFIDTYEVELDFIIETNILEKGLGDLYNNRFVCYNKIIFNDDISSVTQISHDLKAIEDVVIYFDYEKNSNLLDFAIKNIDTNNTEINFLEHIIFYNDKSRMETFKRNLLLKILGETEVFFIKIIQIFVKNWDDFSAQNQQKHIALAFMFEILLQKSHEEEYNTKNISYLVLNNSYIQRETIFQVFEKMNYYGFEILLKYSKLFSTLQKESEE